MGGVFSQGLGKRENAASCPQDKLARRSAAGIGGQRLEIAGALAAFQVGLGDGVGREHVEQPARARPDELGPRSRAQNPNRLGHDRHRIATGVGDSKWISGEEERALSHALRAACDAIMVGVGTVLRDDCRLNVRLVAGASPLRVVLYSTLRTPSEALLLDGLSSEPQCLLSRNSRSGQLLFMGRVEDQAEGRHNGEHNQQN